MSSPKLLTLEGKIDQLIREHKQLQQEVELLQAEQLAWQSERGRLIKQNEQARSRVESMIERLKRMEQTND